MKNMYYKIYNFIAWRNVIFLVSIFLAFIFFVIVIVQGFNLGLDFTGGILVEVTVNKDIDSITIRNAFIQSGFHKVIVQRLGACQDFVIKFPIMKNDNLIYLNIKSNVLNILHDKINRKFTITQINWVSPIMSSDLIKNGIIALLTAIICILMYITFRFEWRLAIGTIISLIYDTIIIIGILSLFAIEIDVTVISALMSAIGYSLNDKIVIFDRIRENFKLMPEMNSIDIFNMSISQVLHRTIITSITTAAVLLILLIFGGSILHGFSIILLIGVIIGTISSIYIASALAFKLGTQHDHFIE